MNDTKLLTRLKLAYKRRGAVFLVKKIAVGIFRRIKNFFTWIYFVAKPTPEFVFRGKRLGYVYHLHNTTWENERAVEISIGKDFVEENKDKKILEIGNTLNHYFRFPHDVVDKYEQGDGIINEDVISFRPEIKYGAIVSISTMEHVGWDEEDRNPKKLLLGVHNLIENCLAPDGVALITMPLGFNSYLDEIIDQDKLPFSSLCFLKKVSKNEWRETDYEGVRGVEYGKPFPYANAIVVGIYHKK